MTHYVIEVRKVNEYGEVVSGRTITEKEFQLGKIDVIEHIVKKLIDELQREEKRVQWNKE